MITAEELARNCSVQELKEIEAILKGEFKKKSELGQSPQSDVNSGYTFGVDE